MASSYNSSRNASPEKEMGRERANSENSESGKSAKSDESMRSEASPPPRKKLIDSDEDNDDIRSEASNAGGATNDAAETHLFGNEVSSDSDDEHGDARKASAVKDDDKSDAASETSIQGIRLYDDEEEEPEEQEEAPPMEHTISKFEFDMGDEPFFCKFPNFLSVETRPFHEDYYEDDEETDVVDEEGRNRLKLKVENTIRWRKVDVDGEERTESNAKVVRWSDGTMSLYLGSEIFDIQVMPVVGNTHLYNRLSSGLSGVRVFEKKLAFRPSSTESKTHRKVTMNMADRSRKSGQVKMLQEVGANPDEAKRESVRREEEQLRANIRRETQQRRVRERPRGLTSSYLESYESDEDLDNAGRSRYRGKGEAPLIGASDSEESDGGRRIEGAKEDESDSDEEFRKKKPQKKKIVSSDEDD